MKPLERRMKLRQSSTINDKTRPRWGSFIPFLSLSSSPLPSRFLYSRVTLISPWKKKGEVSEIISCKISIRTIWWLFARCRWRFEDQPWSNHERREFEKVAVKILVFPRFRERQFFLFFEKQSYFKTWISWRESFRVGDSLEKFISLLLRVGKNRGGNHGGKTGFVLCKNEHA